MPGGTSSASWPKGAFKAMEEQCRTCRACAATARASANGLACSRALKRPLPPPRRAQGRRVTRLVRTDRLFRPTAGTSGSDYVARWLVLRLGHCHDVPGEENAGRSDPYLATGARIGLALDSGEPLPGSGIASVPAPAPSQAGLCAGTWMPSPHEAVGQAANLRTSKGGPPSRVLRTLFNNSRTVTALPVRCLKPRWVGGSNRFQSWRENVDPAPPDTLN